MKSLVTKNTEIKSLTSLRGIAALIVMFFHFRIIMYSPDQVHQYFPGIINNGFLFVDFFFILSGFIMFYVYENFFVNRIDIIKYYSGRIARLAPAMLICIFLWLLFNLIVYLNSGNSIFIDYSFKKILTIILVNIFFLQELIIGYNLITGPSWSVSIEIFFYLIFPFFYIRIFKLIQNNIYLISLLTFISCAIILFIVGNHDENYQYKYLNSYKTQIHHFIQCLGGFTLGACIYHLRKFIKIKKIFIINILQIIVLFIILYLFHINRAGSLIVIFMGLFIFLIAEDKGVIGKILKNNFLVLLGNLSYGIYLYHTIFQIFASKSGFFYLDKFLSQVFTVNYTLFQFVFLSLLTIIFSYCSYYLVEVHLRKLIISITNARKTQK